MIYTDYIGQLWYPIILPISIFLWGYMVLCVIEFIGNIFK